MRSQYAYTWTIHSGVFNIAPQEQAPRITRQPQSQEILAGTEVTLSAAASGTEPLAWQLFRDGQRIEGATNGVVSLPTEAGAYQCTVSNPLGTIQSQMISVTVKSYATCPGTAAIRGGRVLMSFATEPGRTYQILASTDLTARKVVEETEATGSMLEYAEPQPGSARFFACREKTL